MQEVLPPVLCHWWHRRTGGSKEVAISLHIQPMQERRRGKSTWPPSKSRTECLTKTREINSGKQKRWTKPRPCGRLMMIYHQTKGCQWGQSRRKWAIAKTTIIERLSGRRQGSGDITGGKWKARILTKGKQAGHQAGHINRFNQTSKQVIVRKLVPLTRLMIQSYCLHSDQNMKMTFTMWSCNLHGKAFPFTDNKLCVLAYELASRNNSRGFSPLKKHAGRSWLKGFLARYPQLKKKVSQNLSITHAIGANPTQVGNFFNHYRRWIHQWGLECQPNHIWNVDECGIGDVPQTQKVIGLVGERPFQTVSGEKPVNTTLLTYVSAGGLHVPLW